MPFNAIGAMLLGRDAQAATGLSVATTIGMVVHVAMMVVIGLVFRLALARAGGHPLAWAVVVAAATLGLLALVARLFGVGIVALLPTGSLIALGVVLAVTLAIGMRFALSKL